LGFGADTRDLSQQDGVDNLALQDAPAAKDCAMKDTKEERTIKVTGVKEKNGYTNCRALSQRRRPNYTTTSQLRANKQPHKVLA